MRMTVEPRGPLEFWCSKSCGRCCQSKIWMFPAEAGRISTAVKKPVEHFATLDGRQFVFHSRPDHADEEGVRSCIFLRPIRGCEIHRIKPLICRLYPFKIRIGLGDELRVSATPSHSDLERCRELGSRIKVASKTFAKMAEELLKYNAVDRSVELSAFPTDDEYAQRAFDLFSEMSLEDAVQILLRDGLEECYL